MKAPDGVLAALAPPAAVVKVGNEAPLIRYNRNLSGGAHTHGSWNGGWQITQALAVAAGDRSAEDKMLEQIRFNLQGANAISANGGYPAQHERHMTGAYTILRHAPAFWEGRLTREEREKIDLIMKASLVASAYTTSDATYQGGAAPTALDGDRNLNRGWNPNFREGMIGGMLVATVYFGGVDQVNRILDSYNHRAFVEELKAAGLSNIHETFTWAETRPDSGAPNGQTIERNIRRYRYQDKPLMEPMDLLVSLTNNTYNRNVNCGLHDGKGIVVNRVPTGVIAAGCSGLPNRGELGMLTEFDARDGNGLRSSITYAYDGFRPNLTNHVVVLVGGYWKDGDEGREILRRMNVGITDLKYKLEQGYRNYSRGRGSVNAFTIEQPHWTWSFRTTLPLWDEIVKPYHVNRLTGGR